MKIIRTTEEIKAYTEQEAKDIMETIRLEAGSKGYIVGASGYTHKERKARGAVVDECWMIKVVKIYGTMWEENV